MIFYQPLILVSEFIVPVFLIVLAGILLVEYIAYSNPDRAWTDEQAEQIQKKKHVLLALLGIVVVIGVSIFIEQFVVIDRFSGLSLVTQTVFTVVPFGLIYYMVKQHWGATPKILFKLLVIAVVLVILFDALDTFWHIPLFVTAHVIVQIIGVLVFYFFIMQYLISSAEPGETKP